MKKKSTLIIITLLAVVLCVSLTGCIALGGIMTGLDAVYRFVQGFGADELPDIAVYGSDNDLAVGFRNGKLVAFWDVYEGYSYILTVKKGKSTTTYDPADAENPQYASFYGTDCFYLENADVTYRDSFEVSLRAIDKKNIYKTFTASYDGISASDYATYTENVPGGFVDIDRYIATRYEMFEFFSYLLIFRPQAMSVAENNTTYEKVEQEFFMAYDFRGIYGDEVDKDTAFEAEVMSAVASFEDSAAYNYGYEISGNIGKYSLKFYYDPNPALLSSSKNIYRNSLKTNEQIHYNLALGEKERDFPIDSRSRAVKVSTSDQLYFAIKKGYRPEPVAGSNAEYVYSELRRILSVINSDADRPVDKVHKIYDYIVNTVIYDYDFVDNVLERKVDDQSVFFTYNCIYIEGVLGYRNGSFRENERVAICDGLSKAFLCMTQIEGIDSVKVSGTASGGSHAWNKVKVNSRWYMVDTTWGNVLDKNGVVEYLSHDYLMTSDDNDHVEDKWFYYPSANSRYNFLLNK